MRGEENEENGMRRNVNYHNKQTSKHKTNENVRERERKKKELLNYYLMKRSLVGKAYILSSYIWKVFFSYIQSNMLCCLFK
jgi:hypothetical protein